MPERSSKNWWHQPFDSQFLFSSASCKVRHQKYAPSFEVRFIIQRQIQKLVSEVGVW